MEQIRNLGDDRQTGFCCYCGGSTETRDHVPSKAFLDEPYPSNLPVVFACKSCNNGFSLDEEYLSCFLECVACGTTDPSSMKREKVRSIFNRKPALVSRFNQSCQNILDGRTSFFADMLRIKNVVLKLARGHAVYELNEPQLDDPEHLVVIPLSSLDPGSRASFETPLKSFVLPEVGSRGSQRLLVNDPGASVWINVQEGRYRYLASTGKWSIVRIVIGEYLVGEVAWN